MLKTGLDKKRITLILLVSILGFALRLLEIDFESGDWYQSLSVWVKELDHGGLQALSTYSGNYNMPYVTFLLFLTYLPIPPLMGIKCLSILFDYICAFVGGKLAVLCCGDQKRESAFPAAYSAILLAPVVIVNSAWWAQCDSIYVSFIFLAIYAMLTEKTVRSMIFWGVALALKLQTVLALPVLLLYYWKNKKFSFLYFLLIPLTIELLCLPAILGGCSPLVTISTYMGQTGETQSMYYFYSNFWTFFIGAPYWVFGKMVTIGTAVLLLLLSVLVLYKEKRVDQSNILPYFVWLVMTALCFLPNMHDRYGYMLEIGVIIYAAASGKRWWIAVLLQGITMILYAPVYLCRYLEYDPRSWSAVWMAIYLIISFEQISVLMKAELPKISEQEGEKIC